MVRDREAKLVKTVTLDELLEDFEFLTDWQDRYQYIIELGDELTPMPDELKTEETRVQGCVSNVWLVPEVRGGVPPTLRFLADSDSQIVRGLVAILVMLCSDRTADQICQLDLEGIFNRLELRRHLSRSRSNGFYSMIQRIQRLAEQHSEREASDEGVSEN